MAEIAPFRALRYDPRLVPDVSRVVTPPYDVISPEAQADYYARHRQNVVRLILAREHSPESPDMDRYQAAARTYTAWKETGVLRRDPEPALYPYEQEFSLFGRSYRRRGIFTLLKLAEYDEGIVFPHERTFPRHKNDRLQLMRACPAHLESILAFYPGPGTPLTLLLERAMQRDPLVAVTDDDAVTHRLWSMSEATDIACAVATLRNQPVVIADGHHRYETALTFRKERTAQAGPSRAPEQFMLVNLVHAEDPGLVILPTHRVLRGSVPAGADLERLLGRTFQLERLTAQDPASLREILSKGQPPPGVSYVVYLGGGHAIRLIGNGGAVPRDRQQEANVWPDADILHRYVLEELLGVHREADVIAYTHSEAEATRMVDTGHASLAFLLTPPTVGQVQSVALAGGRMPQKSTYFFPKVLSGLLMYPLERGELVPSV